MFQAILQIRRRWDKLVNTFISKEGVQPIMQQLPQRTSYAFQATSSTTTTTNVENISGNSLHGWHYEVISGNFCSNIGVPHHWQLLQDGKFNIFPIFFLPVFTSQKRAEKINKILNTHSHRGCIEASLQSMNAYENGSQQSATGDSYFLSLIQSRFPLIPRRWYQENIKVRDEQVGHSQFWKEGEMIQSNPIP